MAEYSLVDPSSTDPTRSAKSGTLHVDLTDELDCAETRSRLWYLDPGDAVAFHRHGQQEELYFVVRGPGRMRVGDEYIDVPEDGCVRVPPETPRQVLNDADEGRHVWLIVGAPPVEDDGRRITDDGQ